jgi:hypothetical protein
VDLEAEASEEVEVASEVLVVADSLEVELEEVGRLNLFNFF